MINKTVDVSSMAGQQGIQTHLQLPANSTYKMRFNVLLTKWFS